MKNQLKFILIFVIGAVLLFPGSSFAGGGGKGGNDDEPQYFSFEDLRSYLRDKEIFHFENANKPANALVSLGYFMSYPACASKNAMIAAEINKSPSKYKIDSAHVYCGWSDGQQSTFDWTKYKAGLCVGDIIFTRGDDKLNNLVKLFSNWTHVAIVSDPTSNKIFDSTLGDGVKEHRVPDKWQGFGYYTCKRIDQMPEDEKYGAVLQGIQKFKNLPYLPKIENIGTVFTFVYKWCDRNDLSSMYCSKLVYNVFKSFISIDTSRTSVGQNSKLSRTAPCDYLFSWIGVSPDNIYYSPTLGPDFDFSDNIWTL